MTKGGGGGQKSKKIDDVFYEWPLCICEAAVSTRYLGLVLAFFGMEDLKNAVLF